MMVHIHLEHYIWYMMHDALGCAHSGAKVRLEERLQALAKLKNDGVITEAEFVQAKKKILT